MKILLWFSLLCGAAACLLLFGILYMVLMPGAAHRGPLPPFTEAERQLSQELAAHVQVLAGTIGERHIWRYEALQAAARYLGERLGAAGYTVTTQDFQVQGKTVQNVEATLTGTSHSQEMVVVGSHYDSVLGCPGANDNASGVAAMLVLARLLRGQTLARSVRFVAFVNEEAPFAQTAAMGSWVYARQARQRDARIVAMLSLETMGYYADIAGSQKYPFPFGLFYPHVGNFIGFVGNTASRALVRRSIATFRQHTALPSEGTAAPGWLPGIGWSDHWAFWQEGYAAIMVTDTALFRYAAYHTPYDTPEKLDYLRLARVVAGLARVVAELAGEGRL
jgi:hypothetical protein